MKPQTRRRTLIAAFGLLLTVLASRIFYFQELFFAFLFFAAGFLILLLTASLAVVLWLLYARGVVYFATQVVEQGHHALPLLRAVVLWLAPTVTKTAGAISVGQQVLFYPFSAWLRSLRLDASRLREDAERAAKYLRLHLKQS